MGNPSKIQTSFSGGEISPSLFGRIDMAKWNNGAFTMRNMFVSYRGGASSRAGLRYIGNCLQDPGPDGTLPPCRDINFQFNVNQGYALEFGDSTVIRAVSGAASASGLIRLTLDSTRGLMTGQTMTVSGITGTTEANGTWVITVIDGTHVDLNGSTFTNAYVSGGTTSTVAGYMRIKANGAYVVETATNITGATKATPLVVTDVAHGYQNGDWVFITGVGGMTELNGLAWIVTNKTTNDYQLTDMFGNVVNSLNFGAYTSGGIAERIYTIASPYLAVDLPFLKFTQSADTMSLCCWNQDTGTEYPPYDLVRNGATNWVFTEVDFSSSIAAPSDAIAIAHNSTTESTYYSYVVTAVSAATGEESIASNGAGCFNNDISVNAGSNTIIWNAVAGASSYNVYKATPSYEVTVPIGSSYGYAGTAFGTEFTDTNILADFSQVPPVHNNPFARSAVTAVTMTATGSGLTQDTAGYAITTSTGSGFSGTPIVVNGSIVGFIIENGGEGYAPGDTIAFGKKATGTYTFTTNPVNGNTIILNGVTWTFVTAAPVGNQTQIRANVDDTLAWLIRDLNASVVAGIAVATYTLAARVVTITYNIIGTGGNAYTLAAGTYGGAISGAVLTGGTTSTGATGTLTIGPASGTYPGVVAYYQQRRVYANTQNKPDTYFFSHPGAYTNFDTSIPLTDDSAIIGAPWAQQVNGIQAMIASTTGLLMFTGNGVWLLNGGGNGEAITPSNQIAQSQAYNGCHDTIPPLTVNFDTLYVQSKGSIVRDLAYNFITNIFAGTDMTILSSHLFNYQQLVQWCYAEEPYKLIWAVRDDGVLLSLTYLKEQEVYAWSRHDTNGFLVNICSVTEPPVDAVYLITKRYINGQWKYYSERMDNRNWETAEDCFCVDAGLSTSAVYPDATLTPAAAAGTDNISEVAVSAAGSGYTAPIITAISPDGQGTGATFSVTLSLGAITAVTVLTEGTGYLGGTILTIQDATGYGASLAPILTNNVTFTASSGVFTAGDVDSVLRIGNNNAVATADGVVLNGGGKAIITSYVSPTEVVADIIEDITSVIYDNETAMPVPAISGQWSVSPQITTVSGLNHLEGMPVSILADGSVSESQTVTDGSVTLPVPSSLVTVGLPYTCQLQTPFLEVPLNNGTIQGKRKNIGSLVVRTESSRGWTAGTNQPIQSASPRNANLPWADMKEPKERTGSITAGNAIPLFTGDTYLNVPSDWSEYGTAAFQTTNPLPLGVLAVISTFNAGDT